MNYEEKLLKNYILSELYNIEKQQFLAETFESELLEEGVLDLFKSFSSKIKNLFRRDPKCKEAYEETIKKYEELDRKYPSKKYKDQIEYYKKLNSGVDASYFRRNAAAGLTFLITAIGFKVYSTMPEGPKRVEALKQTHEATEQALKDRPKNRDDIINILRSNGFNTEEIEKTYQELTQTSNDEANIPKVSSELISNNPILQKLIDKGLISIDEFGEMDRETGMKYLLFCETNPQGPDETTNEHVTRFFKDLIENKTPEEKPETADEAEAKANTAEIVEEYLQDVIDQADDENPQNYDEADEKIGAMSELLQNKEFIENVIKAYRAGNTNVLDKLATQNTSNRTVLSFSNIDGEDSAAYDETGAINARLKALRDVLLHDELDALDQLEISGPNSDLLDIAGGI